MRSLPRLRADLVLLHPPAVFEFRERGDVYFPFLGTSGDVPITPLYEYFPLGFKTLQRTLGERGHDVRIVNLATLFLKYPTLDLDDVVDALDATLVGIDLHWMVHVQGALEVARRLRARRPDLRVVFGGISSTYYAAELIRYPFIDFVMRGYDTHEPMIALMEAMRSGALASVPNLVWKDHAGEVRSNPFEHVPDAFACGIDWTTSPVTKTVRGLPILEFMSTQNAGCAYDCGWCGGSRTAFRRIFPRERAMARKPPSEIERELDSLKRIPNLQRYHFYSVGSYNESPSGLSSFMDLVGRTGFRSVSYEQFHLPSDDVMRAMVAANPRTSITLSPESHDLRVAKLAGRGVYTNDELERWLARAFDIGIQQVDVWYFVGMPEQDASSVLGTVEYCARLLERFAGKRVNPMICPMIPFLDPASTFFERPDEHGYRVFHHTVADHRAAMTRASIVNRINYETRWLSRDEIVSVGYRAVRDVMSVKAGTGAVPARMAERFNALVDDARWFVPVVHEADAIADPAARAAELRKLEGEILARNRRILAPRVQNQAFPSDREIGARWFDELGWAEADLDAHVAG